MQQSKAKATVSTCIHQALRENHQDPLLLLTGMDAQLALDNMWEHLEKPTSRHPGDDLVKLRRLVLKLAVTVNRLPTSFMLQGVRCPYPLSRGFGSFADVYCGTLGTTAVAIKRLRTHSSLTTEITKKQLEQAFCRESILWKNLSNPYILQFLGVSDDVFPESLCMISPWMENGGIIRYIEKLQGTGKLAPAQFESSVHRWLHQIAQGIEYLHAQGIVHGDLHGGNILVSNEGVIQLADFGMSVLADATAYKYASDHGEGAVAWAAPERIAPDNYKLTTRRASFPSDIYSFGCICIELYTLAMPFTEYGLTRHQILRKVVEGLRPQRPKLPHGKPMADPMWSFVELCWHQDPVRRPTSNKFVHSLRNAIHSSEANVIQRITTTVASSNRSAQSQAGQQDRPVKCDENPPFAHGQVTTESGFKAEAKSLLNTVPIANKAPVIAVNGSSSRSPFLLNIPSSSAWSKGPPKMIATQSDPNTANSDVSLKDGQAGTPSAYISPSPAIKPYGRSEYMPAMKGKPSGRSTSATSSKLQRSSVTRNFDIKKLFQNPSSGPTLPASTSTPAPSPYADTIFRVSDSPAARQRVPIWPGHYNSYYSYSAGYYPYSSYMYAIPSRQSSTTAPDENATSISPSPSPEGTGTADDPGSVHPPSPPSLNMYTNRPRAASSPLPTALSNDEDVVISGSPKRHSLIMISDSDSDSDSE